MDELPEDLRALVTEQARQHHDVLHLDYSLDEWQRIVTGLEREALALVARRRSGIPERPSRKPRKRA